MRIQIEFDPNEKPPVTPLMFAHMVIDFWIDDDMTIQGEDYDRVNLRECAHHIIEFLDAEEHRLAIKRGGNERRCY